MKQDSQAPQASNALSLSAIGSYSSGIFDEGAAEIPAYDPDTQRLFVVNGAKNVVDVLNLSNPNNPTEVGQIDLEASLGDRAQAPNSVAVKNGIVAVAVENANSQNNGQVAFFDIDGQFLSAVEVGALPDMLTFTPEGNQVLVANEGEPSEDYSNDPVGSVSIVDISGGASNLTQANVTTASFTKFNDQKEVLLNQGVRIFGPDATVAQDVEPEYITVSQDSSTAYVALQENNALAVVDIASAEVLDILPLGYKDHSKGNGLDASDEDGGINIENEPTWGMLQPDAIDSFEGADGQTYIITANEGDSRDYEGFSEEVRVADLTLDPQAYPNADKLQAEENLGRLLATSETGDFDSDGDIDQIFNYGGRSFSIFDQFGNLVFDSGDDFEQITAKVLAKDFNSNNDENGSFDSRSDDKGPEPEGLTTGVVSDTPYAFIGLERIGGIMVYDLSNPTSPEFVQYINNRNFRDENGNLIPVTLEEGVTNPAAGDLAPEGLSFIPAEESPNGEPILAVANEVSGTTTLFELEPSQLTPESATPIFGSQENDPLGNAFGSNFKGEGQLSELSSLSLDSFT